jgi:GDP-L-fucose synthase
MNKHDKIWVTGHRGLVGSAVVRELKKQGYANVLTVGRKECDLSYAPMVHYWFSVWEPDYVIHCAAKVGGIGSHMNSPVEFIQENLAINSNVLGFAHKYKTKKLLFLGSACAYPKHAHNPLLETDLLTGPLEPSNKGYALSKIIGHVLCDSYRLEFGDDFISAIPTNVFGPGDSYDLHNSHVLPAMLRKIHEAKRDAKLTLWGTGKPIREFIYSEDLARACIFLMNNYDRSEPVNIGSGSIVRLSDLADQIALMVGFAGQFEWNHNMPDGTPERWLDNRVLFDMGWRPDIALPEGLRLTYEDFLCQQH